MILGSVFLNTNRIMAQMGVVTQDHQLNYLTNLEDLGSIVSMPSVKKGKIS